MSKVPLTMDSLPAAPEATGIPKRGSSNRGSILVIFILTNFGFLLSGMYVAYLIEFSLAKAQPITDLLAPEDKDSFFLHYPLLFPVMVVVLFSVSVLTIRIDRNGKYLNTVWYSCALFIALAFAAYQFISSDYASQMISSLQLGFFQGFSRVYPVDDDAALSDASLVAHTIQAFQSKNRCCGWENPLDYVTLFATEANYIPLSCCSARPFNHSDPFAICNLTEAIYTGCRQSEMVQLINQLEEQFIIQVASIIILFILIIASRK